MIDRPDPVFQRRRLGSELRAAREEAELTREQVAEAMDWSLSKLVRIEGGQSGIQTNDLKALVELYGVRGTIQIDELKDLAKASRQSSWLAKYRNSISVQYTQYIALEEAASVLLSYEPLVIPGLLQTKQYAIALMRTNPYAETHPKAIRDRVEVRMIRQRLLDRLPPLAAVFVMDESAIQRLLGERSVVPDQISKLIDMASRDNITIEIIPFSAGLHRGMIESFGILEFSDSENNDTLFLETSRDFIISRDTAGSIDTYREVFDQLRTISLDADQTVEYLKELQRGYRPGASKGGVCQT